MRYSQCRLEEVVGPNHVRSTVVWIPEELAVKGARLQAKDGLEMGIFWTVTDVYQTVDSSTIQAQRSAHQRWERVIK